MCDYLEAELQPLESMFLGLLSICVIFTEAGMGSVGEKQQQGLTQQEQEDLLALLHQCAWGPLSTIEDQKSLFNLVVSCLKES